MSRVIVVGGGPAGMFAAISAADNGHEVTLIERNEKLGKKLYITGKGRCNLTNTADNEEFLRNIPRNPKFMLSAINRFSARDLMDWFTTNGVPLKEERGKRVFPVSEKASDITKALLRGMEKRNVNIRLNERVKDIQCNSGAVSGVVTDKATYSCDAVILATGGLSYSVTGSTGDGWKMARKHGHTTTEALPALVPLVSSDAWCKTLQGLSLKNVTLIVTVKNKVVSSELGEMLFTHNGISGPLVLSASSILQGKELDKVQVAIDLKPGLNPDQLDKRIQRDISENLNKSIKNAIIKLMPSALVPIVLKLAVIDGEKQANQLTREERQKLVNTVKGLPIKITGFGSMDEAIITRGGIVVKEINPTTMESKLINGLFFAGEMIDVDGFTGGFNLTIAFSTAYVAGNSIW